MLPFQLLFLVVCAAPLLELLAVGCCVCWRADWVGSLLGFSLWINAFSSAFVQCGRVQSCGLPAPRP